MRTPAEPDEEVAGLTARGQRTRAALVAAAREVFERTGFVAARVEDIAAATHVSHGTFYTYFASREDVYRVVQRSVEVDLLSALEPADDVLDHGRASRVERANRRFLEAYRRNAAMAAVIEQVATIDAHTAAERLALRRRFVARSQASLERLQRLGVADPSLDAYHAASALGSMVERFAYIWFVLGDDFDFERAVQTLSRLWVQAVGLEPGRDGVDSPADAGHARRRNLTSNSRRARGEQGAG